MSAKVSLGGIALVTGAAGGVGKDTTLAFTEAGAKGVVFADINQEGAAAAADQSKTIAENAFFKAISGNVDITGETSVDNMV